MLHGEKVTLRALAKADMAMMLRFSQDVEVEVLGGGDPPRPGSIEGWEKWYEEHVAKDDKNGTNFAIEADGKMIGMCGIWRFDLTAQTCMLGIGIGDREYWSKGYGRDAVCLLVDYAFRLRNFRRVWLTTSSANPRAIRCYLACGFVEEGRKRAHLWSDGEYVDEVIMGVLREEWRRP